MFSTEFKSIIDVVLRFPTERSCHEYLASRRWSDGVMICPHEGCNGTTADVFKDGIRYKCKCCRRIYTAKTGTMMEASKIPTIKWFVAIYLTLHKKGISSIQLSKDITVTQKTAWFILQRLRAVFGNEIDVQLEGTIASDETFVGGKNKNRHWDKKVEHNQGRAFIDKTPVLGLLQTEERHFVEREHKVIPGKIVNEKIIDKHAYVKCWTIKDTKTVSIQPLVRSNVVIGSIIVSDEWMAYNGLSDSYQHEVVDHGRKQYVNDSGYTSNAMECGWKHLKLTIQATHHWVSRKHQDRYVQEFSFRYNYRHLAAQQQIDHAISNMAIRLKYKDLIAA
ncbi:IS1595 family transposase [Mucilaginibacter sp.]|uniref:IS1595 family transposase n=1 Tax=Mucilaginibacter sp. TaxID=1882438 RepID=UPI0025CFAE26|nr:IS1595 family transposase [Mucilaginibacter sp.]